MPKIAHLGAPQILEFSCLCSDIHSVVAHLTIFVRFLRTRTWGAVLLAHPRSCQDRPYSANWRFLKRPCMHRPRFDLVNTILLITIQSCLAICVLDPLSLFFFWFKPPLYLSMFSMIILLIIHQIFRLPNPPTYRSHFISPDFRKSATIILLNEKKIPPLLQNFPFGKQL